MRRAVPRLLSGAAGARRCSSLADDPSSEVLVTESGTARLVTLNRIKALNSLNLNIVRIMQQKYDEWAKTGEGHIILKGSGPAGKSFCAGGDVVAIATDQEGSLRRDFFLEEFKLNYTIKTYPLPHIALLDGIVMGGGVGVSVHGSHRIVSERTMFAMPETAIGFFPDVGGSIFLPRMPHAGLGMYLALTGYRLKGADCLHATVGTHFVPSENFPELQRALLSAKPSDLDGEIQAFATDRNDLPPFSLQSQLDRIARTFTLGSVSDIIDELRKDGDEWAEKTLATLEKMSPTSLRVTHEQITRGARQSPHENLVMEARVVHAMMNYGTDFNEGVRALLIDKDKNPKWNPSTLEEVTPEIVAKYFEPRPDGDWTAEKKLSNL